MSSEKDVFTKDLLTDDQELFTRKIKKTQNFENGMFFLPRKKRNRMNKAEKFFRTKEEDSRFETCFYTF